MPQAAYYVVITWSSRATWSSRGHQALVVLASRGARITWCQPLFSRARGLVFLYMPPTAGVPKLPTAAAPGLLAAPLPRSREIACEIEIVADESSERDWSRTC